LGICLFLVDLARNFRFTADEEAGNVYGGGTLEWLPTGLYSTRSIPVVRSRDPLWDDPALPEDVEEGRYFLPNSATGLRETIITSPIRAEPEYLQIMPGPSPWPVAAALFTAGFFLLLTVQAYWSGVVSGVVAVICVLRWLWETDRPVHESRVDIGAGDRLTHDGGPEVGRRDVLQSAAEGPDARPQGRRDDDLAVAVVAEAHVRSFPLDLM
jgi:cytochrome c oxidase subunit I+III